MIIICDKTVRCSIIYVFLSLVLNSHLFMVAFECLLFSGWLLLTGVWLETCFFLKDCGIHVGKYVCIWMISPCAIRSIPLSINFPIIYPLLRCHCLSSVMFRFSVYGSSYVSVGNVFWGTECLKNFKVFLFSCSLLMVRISWRFWIWSSECYIKFVLNPIFTSKFLHTYPFETSWYTLRSAPALRFFCW